MPAIVGSVNINSMTGVMNIGDVRTIAPQSVTKTFAGGGSFNSGTNLLINNPKSIIQIYDSEAEDQAVFIQRT
ncbi:spore germination protein [Brevibacillus fluminis]|uniref:spore germination protein n=1 Tax=Brevibacillus fluminis TaxID=511487 RepID=UPI003398AB66